MTRPAAGKVAGCRGFQPDDSCDDVVFHLVDSGGNSRVDSVGGGAIDTFEESSSIEKSAPSRPGLSAFDSLLSSDS